MIAPPALVALVEAARDAKLAELRAQVQAIAEVARKYPRSAGQVGVIVARCHSGAKWELMAIAGGDATAIEFTGNGCVWSVIATDADLAEVFGP